MKNIRVFISENFQFLVVKLSMYLNRRVFVMVTPNSPCSVVHIRCLPEVQGYGTKNNEMTTKKCITCPCFFFFYGMVGHINKACDTNQLTIASDTLSVGALKFVFFSVSTIIHSTQVQITCVTITKSIVALQTTVLHMKRLNKTESLIFVILYVLCFQR